MKSKIKPIKGENVSISASAGKHAKIGLYARNSGTPRKIYVIRRDSSDWTPIVAVITGPQLPTLSTMIKRFHEQFDFYIWDGGIPEASKIVARINQDHDAIKKAQGAGYAGYNEAELFLDWLLKTDQRFERVGFQEVSL